MNALIMSIGGLAGAVARKAGSDATFWMPEQASSVAPTVDYVFYVVYWLSVVFFVGIVAAMLLFAFRYRRRHVDQRAQSQVSHNNVIETLWTVIPLGLVVWIFWIGFTGFLDLRTPPANSYQIAVTAQKWSWSFTYPNGYVTDKLHVPVDRPVELTMTSEDVIHSFFVPAFRVKMDVVPGKYTKAWFQATGPGEYPLFCTEYCGTQHSQMLSNVIVHEPGGFEPWLAEASEWIDKMPPAEAGQRVYQVRGCTQCHTVDGVNGIGPTFKGIFGREEQFADGSRGVVDENYIRESILYPQAKIVAGYEPVMPTYQGRLKDNEITVLIEYLKTLK